MLLRCAMILSVLGGSAAQAQQNVAAPLECAALDALVRWGIVQGGEAETLARGDDAAACDGALRASGLVGLGVPACRAAMERLLAEDLPGSGPAGGPFDDPSVLFHDVMTGDNPVFCTSVIEAG